MENKPEAATTSESVEEQFISLVEKLIQDMEPDEQGRLYQRYGLPSHESLTPISYIEASNDNFNGPSIKLYLYKNCLIGWYDITNEKIYYHASSMDGYELMTEESEPILNLLTKFMEENLLDPIRRPKREQHDQF